MTIEVHHRAILPALSYHRRQSSRCCNKRLRKKWTARVLLHEKIRAGETHQQHSRCRAPRRELSRLRQAPTW